MPTLNQGLCSVSHSAGEQVHTKPRGSTARRGDLNWTKEYSIPQDTCLVYKLRGADSEPLTAAQGQPGYQSAGREQLDYASLISLGFYSSFSFAA